jgi:hypothetical protein
VSADGFEEEWLLSVGEVADGEGGGHVDAVEGAGCSSWPPVALGDEHAVDGAGRHGWFVEEVLKQAELMADELN